MESNSELSAKNSAARPVMIVAVLITYLIAGFFTACICGIAYLIIN